MNRVDILNAQWVEALPVEQKHAHPNGVTSWRLPPPTHPPVREPVRTAPRIPAPVWIENPPLPRGFVPYIYKLWGDLDPSSIRSIERYGNVYLCSVHRMYNADPIVPIIWPVWIENLTDRSVALPEQLHAGYSSIMDGLSQIVMPWLSYGIKHLLSYLASQGAVSDPEYAYIEGHLLAAAQNPRKYR